MPAPHPLRNLGEILDGLAHGFGVALSASRANPLRGIGDRRKAEPIRASDQTLRELIERARRTSQLGVLKRIDELAEAEHEGIDLRLEVGLVISCGANRGHGTVVHAPRIG